MCVCVCVHAPLGVAAWLITTKFHSWGPWKGSELCRLFPRRRQALYHIRSRWPVSVHWASYQLLLLNCKYLQISQDLGLSGEIFGHIHVIWNWFIWLTVSSSEQGLCSDTWESLAECHCCSLPSWAAYHPHWIRRWFVFFPLFFAFPKWC